MEPGFYRGDILFLYKPNRAPATGDISAQQPLPALRCIFRGCHRCLRARLLQGQPDLLRAGLPIGTHPSTHPPRLCAAVVFNTDGREIPIVHRIIKTHQRAANSSSIDILTKVRPCRQEGASASRQQEHPEKMIGLWSRSSAAPMLGPALTRRATTTGETTAACTPRASCGSTRATSWGSWSGEALLPPLCVTRSSCRPRMGPPQAGSPPHCYVPDSFIDAEVGERVHPCPLPPLGFAPVQVLAAHRAHHDHHERLPHVQVCSDSGAGAVRADQQGMRVRL